MTPMRHPAGIDQPEGGELVLDGVLEGHAGETWRSEAEPCTGSCTMQ